MRASSLAKYVQENLGVRLGVHVTQIVSKHLLAERLGIDEVAVVGKRDPVGGIDVEGLCFLRRLASRGRIADVPDAHAPAQRLHVMRVWKTSRTSPLALRWWTLRSQVNDAGRVLPAMLERGERVVQVLIDVPPADDSDDTAHCSRIRLV